MGTGTAEDIHRGLENAVSNEMSETAATAVSETFLRLHAVAPLKVETITKAAFDLTPMAPRLTDVHVTVRVHLAEARPANELRQAREAFASSLRHKGWRVDGSPDSAAPNVTLVMEPSFTPAAVVLPNETRPYLVLGALVLGAFSFCIVAFWMLARGFRALRKPRQIVAPSEPRILQNPIKSDDPDVGLESNLAVAATQTAASAPKVALSAPDEVPPPPFDDFAASLRRKIAALPLDKAIEALSALDPRTRRHIIGTLDLKEPVRRSLEEAVTRST